ncbi:hypothetical protein G6F41_006274 [Rhizopus arrhizus]|nr:hypothetical protein G6F41_006274 [Rhizopus arrhizus]
MIQVARPFLKGSWELATFRNGDENLWAVADQIRKENQHLYAELTVSPSMYQQLCSKGLNLPSFDDQFDVFPSMSPSAELMKVTLSGLPHQYGRRDGGLSQLHTDMQRNLSPFGKIVDSGIIKGSSGVYSGKGYVVLEKPSNAAQPPNGSTHRELQHNVHWVYQPLAYSASSASSPLLAAVEINCNKIGHIAKYCDRKNVSGPSGALNKRARKTYLSVVETTSATLALSTPPVTSPTSIPATSVFIPATPAPVVLAKSKYACVLRSETAGISSTNTTTTANKSSSKSTTPVKICPHYLDDFVSSNMKDIRKSLYESVDFRITHKILAKLNDDMDPIVIRLLLCVKPMIETLPSDSQKKAVLEFQWTNEACFNDADNDLQDRPDGCIENDDLTIGYLEVKPIGRTKDHKKINMDLYRLGVFSKAATTKYKLKHIFQVMAVGTNLQFHINELKGNVLTMVELDHFRLPLSMDELLQLIAYLHRLYNVVATIYSCCYKQKKLNGDMPSDSSLEPRVLKAITVKTSDRTRKNYLYYPYH